MLKFVMIGLRNKVMKVKRIQSKEMNYDNSTVLRNIDYFQVTEGDNFVRFDEISRRVTIVYDGQGITVSNLDNFMDFLSSAKEKLSEY